jgi:hypothetical protein
VSSIGCVMRAAEIGTGTACPSAGLTANGRARRKTMVVQAFLTRLRLGILEILGGKVNGRQTFATICSPEPGEHLAPTAR